MLRTSLEDMINRHAIKQQIVLAGSRDSPWYVTLFSDQLTDTSLHSISCSNAAVSVLQNLFIYNANIGRYLLKLASLNHFHKSMLNCFPGT